MKRHARAAEGDWAGSVQAKQATVDTHNEVVLITMATLQVIDKTFNQTYNFTELTVDAKKANVTGDLWDVVEVDIKGGTPAIDVKLEISQSAMHWKLSKVTYDSKEYPMIDVGANWPLSYACNEISVFHYNNPAVLIFTGFQIEPNFIKDHKILSYGYANNCTGFFSAVIWGALFVIFLLIGILAIGLSFIMDINTMDRFDDPKGKTITINAAD